MKSPPSPDTLESQKRRRERILILLILIIVVAITFLEVYLARQGGQPVTGSLLAFSLLNINTFLLLLFAFLIFRQISKLFLERQRKVFGSRLRTRLVLTFISLTLLPTLILLFISWQLITSCMDRSWDRQVEKSLDKAIDLTRIFSLDLEDNLKFYGRVFTQELQEQDRWSPGYQGFLQSFTDQNRVAYHLTGLEILDIRGSRLAASYNPRVGHLPKLPAPVTGAAAAGEETVIRQTIGPDELLNLQVPVTDAASNLNGFLLLRKRIPKTHLLRVTEVTRSLKELRQRQLQLSPMKMSQYLTLVIASLVAMMAAIWLGFYMAREITTPIRQLAEGAIKVAGGDYDIHIDQEGRDEIGFLVRSFNQMTQDLQQSQAQLAAAYRQLSESHELISIQKRDMEILLKNVAAGVISIDAGGRLTTLNDSAAQMLNWQREEVLGQDCRDLLPPREYQRLAEVIATARHSPRGAVETPLHVALPDNTLYLLIKPTVLKDESGQDLGVVIVFEDLTELERAQRLAAWREVARAIAHEVKNPLTPIKLAAQRLRCRYLGCFTADDQIFDESTQIIINQVDELKNLVNEFSRFARLPQLTLAPQDLNVLIQETMLLYREVQPRITMEFQPDPDLPPVLLDREQMKRVLLNLMDNALAAIPGFGTITISLKGDLDRDLVQLTVADSGGGIPDRDKVRIFEPYFSTKRGGTGLGLAIVNSIIADHHWEIRVKNNMPQGTKIVIDLPIHRKEYAGHIVSGR